MLIDWFSYVFGAIVVLVLPMMTVIVWFDTYRNSSRYERLSAWQFVTLLATTMLALYTYFYVHRYGMDVLIAEAPLWYFCGFGITLSLALAFGKHRINVKQRRLEERLVRAVLQP